MNYQLTHHAIERFSQRFEGGGDIIEELRETWRASRGLVKKIRAKDRSAKPGTVYMVSRRAVFPCRRLSSGVDRLLVLSCWPRP